MLILPIVNKNRILNVQVSLKNASKTRSKVTLKNIKASDINVNGKNFSDFSYDTKSKTAAIDFIRNSSIVYKRDYIITTKSDAENSSYDIYDVKFPPKRINESLDNLYNCAVLDMQKEVPNKPRGKYISLKDLGIDKSLTDDRLARMARIISSEKNSAKWPDLLKKAELFDLVETLEFINMFECTVISETTIPENLFQSFLNVFQAINTRDARSLNRYYTIAKDNQEVYSKIAYIHKTLTNTPYTLIQSKNQRAHQLIKTKETQNAA